MSKYVCESCIEDEHLAQVIRDHEELSACDYCGKGGVENSAEPIVAPLESVVDYMRYRIEKEWRDPVDELPYDGREGGYQGEVLTACELFPEIDYCPNNAFLYEDLLAEFSDEHWCRRNYFEMRDHERMLMGWSSFVRVIKHTRRYTFWTMGDAYDEEHYHPDHIPIGTLLQEIGNWMRTADLFTVLPLDSELWRVRVHDASKCIATGRDLGSPPHESATQPNRMSPDGVSMFYGSSDLVTACLETVNPKCMERRIVTGGMFRPIRPLQILDLHEVPEVPGFWDPNVRMRAILTFLHRFSREISRPIKRDGVDHLDYVPTQALTEYVRYEMKTPAGNPVDGLCYSSSRNRKRCYVIFADHGQCEEPDKHADRDQLLELDIPSLRRLGIEAVRDLIKKDRHGNGGADECLFP